jgi:MraZ protein
VKSGEHSNTKLLFYKSDMLLGQYTVSVTDKGRLALPHRMRDELGTKLIAAKWFEGCLVIVAIENWDGLLTKVTAKAETLNVSVREIERFILGSAFEIELDAQGRFVIPKALKEYAVLDDKSVFVGLGNRIEVWNEAKWREKEEFLQGTAGKLMEQLSDQLTRKY